MLTDMRDVLPQIYDNVQANAELIEAAGGSATVSELDWIEPDDEVRPGGWGRESEGVWAGALGARQ
jgi:hypothetical protein